MKQALIIFTRVPIPGKTKTRLMPFLSGVECAGLHQSFITDIFKKMKQVHADLFVFYTPEDEENLLKTIVTEDILLYPQKGENLGVRMKRAIGDVLQKGYEKVLLIGTDIPQMSPEAIEEAFASLDEKDIVINPTLDGGYYLIGMKKEYDSIWNVERYGTNTVIHDTLNHMKKEKLTVAKGQVYFDVDDKEDLLHLYKEVKEGTIHNCPVTEEYLKGILLEKLERNYDEL